MSFDGDLAGRLRAFLAQAFESAGGPGAYAAGIYIHYVADDGRRPVVVACLATEAGVEEAMRRSPGLLRKRPVPADENEARWDIAFWSHPDLARFGDPDEDPDGAEAFERWIRLEGLWYSDEEEERDFDRAWDRGEEIDRKVLAMLAESASELHRELVPRVFGSAIPIVIQDPDFEEPAAEATSRANPPGLARDYLTWLRGRPREPDPWAA